MQGNANPSINYLSRIFAVIFMILGTCSLCCEYFQKIPNISFWLFGLAIIFIFLPFLKELNLFGMSFKFQERLEGLENISLNNEVVCNSKGDFYFIFKNLKYRIENNDDFTCKMLSSHKGIINDPKLQSAVEKVPFSKTIKISKQNILKIKNEGMYFIVPLEQETAFYISSWTALNQHGISDSSIREISLDDFKSKNYQLGR